MGQKFKQFILLQALSHLVDYAAFAERAKAAEIAIGSTKVAAAASPDPWSA